MRGRVTATVGGRALAFRLPTSAESEEYLAAAKRAPGASLVAADELLTKCAEDPAAWAAAADEYPLAVDELLPALFREATKAARGEVRAAIRRWRHADTNLGRMAENLLAFKAYAGGDPDERTFAGALLVAEWFDSTRRTSRLLEGLIKGLSRR